MRPSRYPARNQGEAMSTAKLILSDLEMCGGALGSGAYGTVHGAKWCGIDVAVKRLHPTLVGRTHSESVYYRQFEEEMERLASLRHKHILQYFGVAILEGDTLPSIVTERLAQTLRERCQMKPRLTGAEQLRVAVGVAAGLSYLHSPQVNIIHRDLTTNNIMVTEIGGCEVKITDIGGSKKLRCASTEEELTCCPGGQTYMAPEALPVQDASASASAAITGQVAYGLPMDVFALGVCLMSMANCKEPSIQALGEAGREDDKAALDGHFLHSVVVDCLQKSPSSRPTAALLCDKLSKMSCESTRLSDYATQREQLERAQAEVASLNSMVRKKSQLIETKIRQADQHTSDMEQMSYELEQKSVELEEKRDRLKFVSQELAVKTRALEQWVREVGLKSREIEAKSSTIEERDLQITTLKAQLSRLEEEVITLKAGQGSENGMGRTSEHVEELSAARRENASLMDRLNSAKATVCLAEYHRHVNSVLRFALAHSVYAHRQGELEQQAIEEMGHAAVLLSSHRLYVRPLSMTKWRTCGSFPQNVLDVSAPACINGKVTLRVRQADRVGDSFFQSPIQDLETWTSPPGPSMSGGSSFFFEHDDHLYYLYSPKLGQEPPVLCKRAADGDDGRWVPVARLQFARVNYGAILIGTSVVVVGGVSTKENVFVLGVEAISLTTLNITILPTLPKSQSRPQLLFRNNKIHSIERCSPRELERERLTLDLTKIENGWYESELPRSPYPDCAWQIVNGRIVVAGGSVRAEPSSAIESVPYVFVLDDVFRQWQPLPPLLFRSQCGFLFCNQGRVFYLGGRQYLDGNHTFVDTIEVLAI